MTTQHVPKRVLTVFSLVMINVIAVDSLRILPFGAQFGFALVFYYSLAALLFFIPTALVTAELATAWPQRGGIYIWVREAFGNRAGFLVVWLQWVYNIVWFPTMLAFIAGTIAYVIHPNLVENKGVMLGAVLAGFWLATLLNFFGMKFSSWISALGSIFGTLLPMAGIIVLAVFWLLKGNPSEIAFNTQTFFPDFTHMSNVMYLVAIVYGLVGLEMSAVHASEVKHPQRDYPRALLISVVVILFSLILSSLSVAIVVPHNELNLVAGLMQAFGQFFEELNIPWMSPVLASVMALAGLASVVTWIIGPTKALLAASEDNILPRVFQETNSQGVPVVILLTQALVFSIISTVFLLLPTVSASYWFLTDLAAELALLMYTLLFAAAIRLRYKKKEVNRPFQLTRSNLGMWGIAGVAVFMCVAVFVIGFLPPEEVSQGEQGKFQILLGFGIIVMCLPAFLIREKR